MAAKPKASAASAGTFAPQTASVGEIADLLGVSTRRVQQLVGDGFITNAGHGVYDVRDCVRGYLAALKDGAPSSASGKAAAATIAESKARREAAMAEIAEIELAQLKGELVPAEQVEDAWVAMASNMRAKMLELPGLAGPEAMTAANPYEAAECMKRYVHAALEELSNADAEDPDSDGTAGYAGDVDAAGFEAAAESDGLGVG